MSTNGDVIIKKKRGRKPKKKPETPEEKVPKKRGRKPRGGKIVSKTASLIGVPQELETNIILHLKCNTKQLEKKERSLLNNKYSPKIYQPESFSLKGTQKLNTLTFESIDTMEVSESQSTPPQNMTFQHDAFKDANLKTECKGSCKQRGETSDDVNIKEVWKKLSNLQYQLFKQGYYEDKHQKEEYKKLVNSLSDLKDIQTDLNELLLQQDEKINDYIYEYEIDYYHHLRLGSS